MPKILKDSEYTSLKLKADNYDAIVAEIVKANSNLTSEEITPEVITEAISKENEPNADIQAKLTDMETQLKTANVRITELETENANLKESAGEQPAGVKTKSEMTGEKESLKEFADKNAGDTQAILAKAKEEGFI
jgi:hypothetical protein